MIHYASEKLRIHIQVFDYFFKVEALKLPLVPQTVRGIRG